MDRGACGLQSWDHKESDTMEWLTVLLPLPVPDTALATGIKQYPMSIFKKQGEKISVFLEHALNKTQLNKFYEIERIKIKLLYKVMEINWNKNGK